MQRSVYPKLLGALGLAAAISACAVTTATTESSSETLQNTSDASFEFTSSTSPRDESKDTAERRVKEFAVSNFERLREDMAVGSGEYLSSLAALLSIPEAKYPAFFKLTKDRFSTWFRSKETTPDQVIAALSLELASHPELGQ